MEPVHFGNPSKLTRGAVEMVFGEVPVCVAIVYLVLGIPRDLLGIITST
jgi:hypothetical protein